MSFPYMFTAAVHGTSKVALDRLEQSVCEGHRVSKLDTLASGRRVLGAPQDFVMDQNASGDIS